MIAGTAAAVLWLPAEMAQALGFIALRETHRSEFGLLFIAGLLALVGVQLFDKGSLTQRGLAGLWERHSARDNHRKNLKLLENLTPDEKAYLRPYIKDGQAMQRFNLEDGIAGALHARGIIFCGARIYDQLTGAEFSLAQWAREHLDKNPQLLKGASRIKPRDRFRIM